jgi:AraC family transcriptional regulator, regulatory protein of adaptative response / methylated-DNA-[protein]-cysteine methyltransferase
MEIRYTTADTKLGVLLVARSEKGICSVSLSNSHNEAEESLRTRFAKAAVVRDDTALENDVSFVGARINGRQLADTPPLDLSGTEFQRDVWNQLLAIPAGSTRTYGDIANAINRPKATRAVAQACGANPIAVVVPCHRVVMSDGSIGGYSGLPGVKKALLEAEGVDRFSAS